MNQKPYNKRRLHKKCDSSKLGICMILLGFVALAALFLPLKYWALMLSGLLIFFGCLLIK